MKLRWEPTTKQGAEIAVPDHTKFMHAMAEAGFALPCTLTDNDLPLLRAMAAVGGEPYKTIVWLVVENDTIDLILTTP